MKLRPSQLFPLFRTDTQGSIVAELFNSPEKEWTTAELEQRTGASAPTVSRELARLVAAELVRDRRYGARQKTFQASRTHPLFAAVSEIANYSYGPVPVLESVLGDVPGIAEAFIYGSWAARRTGEAGRPPQDIDVLLVGSPDDEQLDGALREAEHHLQREVNVTRMSHDRWHAADDPFTRSVRERPLHPLRLNREENQ